MEPIIKISHLNKSYKDVKAVNDLSFTVNRGELFAFLGVNGAGKSTTIHIICSQLSKDSGEVIIDGYAFSKFEGGYRVLNLNASDKAAVFAADGTVLETTMNDIELHIASKYLHASLKYMEA